MKSSISFAPFVLYASLSAISAYAQLLAGQTNQLLSVITFTSCIAATSNTDGASVVFTDCTNVTDANSWVIAGGQFDAGTIKIFGDKCLDVKDGVNADGTKLQIWTCASGNTNQQFLVNGQQIEWDGKNKCIDLTDGKTTDGNPIQVWTCDASNNNNNQKWNEKGLNEPKSLQIEWKSHPNLCVTGASNNANAKVVLDNCANPSGNSTWFFPAPGTVATYDNLCMSAPAGISDGGKVVLLPCNGSNIQEWNVNTGVINTPGLFAKQVLDVTDGNATIGNQLQTWGGGIFSVQGDNPNQDFIVKFTF